MELQARVFAANGRTADAQRSLERTLAEATQLGLVGLQLDTRLTQGAIGVVSGYRSLGGSNYLQFTAAISPGNSGGPVIDSSGRVVAIASAKLIYPGAEALSLGIPVEVACDSLVVCKTS